MNDLELKNAFLLLTAGADGEKTAAMVRSRLPEYRHRTEKKYCRAALIILAAGLLAVSVCAYGILRKSTASIDFTSDGYYFNADFSGITDQSAVKLSRKVLSALPDYSGEGLTSYNPHDVGKIFDSWQDAADWLDCGILTSDIITSDCIPNLNGEIVLVSIYSGDTLTNVSLHGTTMIKDHDAYCKISIVIPQSPLLDGMSLFQGYGYAVGGKEDNAETVMIEYTTSGGDVLEIPVTPPRCTGSDTDGYTAYAHFVSGGIIYSFGVCSSNAEQSVDILLQILEDLK